MKSLFFAFILVVFFSCSTSNKATSSIDSTSNFGVLLVKFKKKPTLENSKTQLYLSKEPLTNMMGQFIMESEYIRGKEREGDLILKVIAEGINEFNFTNLPPGKYYLTCVADLNNDGYASQGDATSSSILIEVKAGAKIDYPIVPINYQN